MHCDDCRAVCCSDGDGEYQGDTPAAGEALPQYPGSGSDAVITTMEDPVSVLVDTAAAVQQDPLDRPPSSRKRRLVASEAPQAAEASV
jgi:hypothetical protein